MRFRDFHPILHEAWAIREAFRKLGFRSEEIAVGIGEVHGVGPNQVIVMLATQGKEFRAVCGEPYPQDRNFEEDWDACWKAFLESSEEEAHEVWLLTRVATPAFAASFLATLFQRGFMPPNVAHDVTAEDAEVIGEMLGQPVVGLSPGGKA